MSKHVLCGIALVLLLLSGCASNPDVQLVELSQNTVVYDEIIRINNCGGTGDSEQTKSREFATTVEFGAGVSAGYQSIVQGSLSAKYSEYRNTSVSQRVVAPPGTNMEFVLRWSDDVRAGNVQVNGKSGTYEVRIPVSVEQVSSRDLGCGISAPVQPTVPSIQPTQQSSSPVGVYTVSCDWARDWKKQPDGSYLWIGQPPGTPACQNVGQAGDLLQRLRNGENITLIVDVGDVPLGLSICKGTFTATTVVPGEYCVPNNPEKWPRVTGRLVVTGSDGFMVGTGK
jgi:hypothetical protein